MNRSPEPSADLRARCAEILQQERSCAKAAAKPAWSGNANWADYPPANESICCWIRTRTFSRSALGGYKMYEQWGSVPAAGAVAGIGNVAGVPCMIIANDATVKAGAFFPADGQESAARPADRLRMRAAADLPGRFRRRFPADAGRDLSRRRRFRPHLSQQRRHFRRRHSAIRRHHGQLRRRRRLSAGAVRQDADDRRQRPLSRRARRWSKRPSGRSSSTKNWAARTCTPRSAAPSTFTRRTIRPA